ncbi:MAG TPA: alpha/beta hydrolase [Gammaproteobacteria bacterium]|nr:alpha/beta hydrolase [Gammaproteobacteria bacterium]HIK70955.1 alpha/beta hydrolase [Pseudomonadales bacterium]
MSIRAALMNFVIRRTVKPQLPDKAADVKAFREQMAGASNLMPKAPAGIAFEACQVNQVSCEWVSPEQANTSSVLLYFHGGGYVMGDAVGHRNLSWRLARASGMRVLMVNYRLAPETPFPGALEDATAVFEWLLSQGYAADKIVIGGDSAGGGLALATLLNLKNLGSDLPAAAILISPWVDLTLSGKSYIGNKAADPMLTRSALAAWAECYLSGREATAPLASPLFADLNDLPPMLVHVGSTEILNSDSESLVDKVIELGGSAALKVWPKMVHVFHLFAGRIPEADQAINELGDYCRANMENPS